MPVVKHTHPKAFQNINLKVQALANLQAKVGWFESAKYEDGTPVACAAALNELGHGNTPPRPFMRPAAINHKQEWAELEAEGAKQMLAGNATPHRVMEMMALKAEGDVVKSITEVNAPPLSPVTIELRAMKKRNPGLQITATTVGIAAHKVAQPGYETPDVSVKPLNDTGHMISTVSSVVEESK